MPDSLIRFTYKTGKAGQYFHCLRFVVGATSRNDSLFRNRLLEVRHGEKSNAVLTATDGYRLFQWMTPTQDILEEGYYEVKSSTTRAVLLEHVGDFERIQYPDWEQVVRDFSRLTKRSKTDDVVHFRAPVEIGILSYPFVGKVIRAMHWAYINTDYLTNLHDLGSLAIPGDWSVIIRNTIDDSKQIRDCGAPLVFRSPADESLGRLRALIMPIRGDDIEDDIEEE